MVGGATHRRVGDVRLAFQHVAGGAEVADVGHAAADEDLVDLFAGHLGQELHVVRIVGAGDDRLLDLAHVDLEDGGVFGVRVGCEERRLGEPRFHGGDAAFQGAAVRVAIGDHPLEEGHVRARVLDHRLFGEAHGGGCRRAFSRSVGQLERLFDLQVFQALDFQDHAGEDVLLALLLDGQQAALNGDIRNGVDQIAQRDARLHACP